MQASVAAVLASVAQRPHGVRALVMDCLPNMQQDSSGAVFNSTARVLAQLRAALGPGPPILVLEGHEYTNNWIAPQQAANQDGLCGAQRSAFDSLQGRVPNLHYAGSAGKLGGGAVAQDSTGGIGVHPTQLGHLHNIQDKYISTPEASVKGSWAASTAASFQLAACNLLV